MKKLLLLFFTLALSTAVRAQCDFNPTITSPRLGAEFANTILFCAISDSETLSTQEYDSYQWFRRDIFAGGDFDPVPGATSQTLTVDEADVFFEFFVETTLDECTEQSQTVVVDIFAFGLPFMITTFEQNAFEQSGQNEFNVCEGSVVTFENGFPVLYGEHVWFRCTPSAIPPDPSDGCIITGETGDNITVTESGNYGFYSCTAYCPELCEFLGDQGFIQVNFGEFDFCENLSTDDLSLEIPLTTYPNPTSSFIFINPIDTINQLNIEIFDIQGKSILFKENHQINIPIDISHLASGTYFMRAKDIATNKTFKNRFIKN